MYNRFVRRGALLCLWLWCALGASALALDFPTGPATHAGQKWRLGYVQGGAYPNYLLTMKATLSGLMDLGWVEKKPIPDTFEPADTKGLWVWMGTQLRSDYLEFVQDAFWDGMRDESLYPQIRQDILERLNRAHDLDLMLALGTWSGQALANDEHSTPTMVMSTTDPIGAKIIRGVDDSGRPHIHAWVDPTRHEQQVRLFHDIIGFKRLGVAYEDSEEGRGFSGIASIERVAGERGFELVRCFAPYTNLDKADQANNIVRCHEELAPKIDAIYITRHPGVNAENMPRLLQPLLDNKVPSFSQAGSQEVENGVLLSILLSQIKYLGVFYAQTMAKIFNGAKPGELPQFFRSPPSISINLENARLIEYDPPIDILGAADEIYLEIPWLHPDTHD